MLQASSFYPYLEKIAQIISSTERSSSRSGTKNSTGISNIKSFSHHRDRNLDDTLPEARTNANLQPLNKNRGKPLDFPTAKIKTKKNMKMSHLTDNRLFDYTKDRGNNLRSFSPGAIPLKTSVI